MLLLGSEAHPSPDRGLFPLIPAHGLGGRETSNFLPLLVIQSIQTDFGSSQVPYKKRKAPGKTGGLALTSLGGDPLRRYIKLREINKMPSRNARIISP